MYVLRGEGRDETTQTRYKDKYTACRCVRECFSRTQARDGWGQSVIEVNERETCIYSQGDGEVEVDDEELRKVGEMECSKQQSGSRAAQLL